MGQQFPTPMAVFEQLRDLLASVTWGLSGSVQTAKIGLEAGMTADDYPIVRLVPSVTKRSELEMAGLRAHELLIYFGAPIVEADNGLEALYADLFLMEVALIEALPIAGDFVARWQETILDEDRVPGYKLMALRVLVDG